MPAWSEMVKTQNKEELDKLKYQKKVLDREMKRKELDIKDKLDKIDYLEKLGINVQRILDKTFGIKQPFSEQPNQLNEVTTPTNTPYLG